MYIAHYYPKSFSDGPILFQSYTGYKFINNSCNKDVDLIYSASTSVLDKALKAKEEYNKELVCWVWDIPNNWRDWVKNDPIGYKLNSFRDEANHKTIENLKKCDLVISSSKYTQSVLKTFDIDSHQIYYYIDTHGLDSVPSQQKENQIIQISRYFFNKRFEVSILATRDLPYKTVCCGFGKDYCKARLLGLPNSNMELYCDLPTEYVIRHLKRSKLLVSPSVFEGWGITPIEALYCKIPILLSDLEVFKEVYGDNIIYHERDNIDDMTEKIDYIMKNKGVQEKIVKKGTDCIRSFTPKLFANRWKKAIN